MTVVLRGETRDLGELRGLGVGWWLEGELREDFGNPDRGILCFPQHPLGREYGFPVQAQAYGSLQRSSGALQALLRLLEEVIVAIG